MFFTVMWRGLCQALGWLFGLFGYKRDGKFAKCVWGMFATSAAVIVGIFAIAKFVEYVFENAPAIAYCAILGLIVGSPIAILAMAQITSLTLMTVLTSVVAFLLGCVIALKLGE